MRAVVQRVSRAGVAVGGEVVSRIGRGMLILVAIERGDADEAARALAGKIARWRFFPDEAGRMNVTCRDAGGAALVVSQVTLVRQPSRGNRPSFDQGAPPEEARRLCGVFAAALRAEGIAEVGEGVFGASMAVELVNDGPVTFVFEA